MKEEQNSRPLNAPTDGNGDREKKEREINMQVMERFIRFINTGDCGIGEGIISPEPMHGFKGYKDVLDMMRGAMPDVKWTAEEIIADGNKVMVRFTMSGTHTNPFMGMPATGRPISVTAMNIYELKDGKIIREHGLPDLFSMLIQLGMLSAPGQELQD